jgi:hypothetical protein
MRNKIFAALLSTFFLALNMPMAPAADVPVLTWERGKEHNIILGGSNAQGWDIVLHKSGSKDLAFSKSKANNRGFVVFSINIPNNFPLDSYLVETQDKTGKSNVVAGVRLVKLSDYNVSQIPTKLFTLLLVLIFVISSLSVLRLEKYQKIEYIREKRSVTLPNFFARFYELRKSSVESIRKSLFKFLITREGEMLHMMSPLAWAIVPILTSALGVYVGVSTRVSGGVSHVSVALFVILALIGIIDPYSGFMGAVGFAFAQTVIGNVAGIKSVMGLLAVGLALVGPGIFSSLFRNMLLKDVYIARIPIFFEDVVPSIIGALIFVVAEILTNSFTNHIGSFGVDRFFIPVGIAIFIFLRIRLEKFIFRNIHIGGESYQVRTLTLPRVISPRTVGLAALYLAGVVYSWTESGLFATSAAFILIVPLILLLVRFESPRIKFLGKFDRKLLVEPLLMCAVAFSIFTEIRLMPFDVNQKAHYLIISTAVILILHAIFSSLADTSRRQNVSQL